MSTKHLWWKGIGLAALLALLLGCTASPGEQPPTPSSTPTETAPPPVAPSPTPTVTPPPGGAGSPPTAEPPPLCPQLELAIDFQQTQSLAAAGMHSEMTAYGKVPLSVETASEPATVHGEGELPVSGGGQAGDCSWAWTGTLAYRLEGEIAPGPNGDLEVRLRGERMMNITAVGGECGGGGGAPFEPIGELTLPYEEGATKEWTWGFPAGGVEGSSTWTLHILCSP